VLQRAAIAGGLEDGLGHDRAAQLREHGPATDHAEEQHDDYNAGGDQPARPAMPRSVRLKAFARCVEPPARAGG